MWGSMIMKTHLFVFTNATGNSIDAYTLFYTASPLYDPLNLIFINFTFLNNLCHSCK